MVVSSNPGTGYWMDIFRINLLQIVFCLLEKDRKEKKKRPRMVLFKSKTFGRRTITDIL